MVCRFHLTNVLHPMLINSGKHDVGSLSRANGKDVHNHMHSNAGGTTKSGGSFLGRNSAQGQYTHAAHVHAPPPVAESSTVSQRPRKEE